MNIFQQNALNITRRHFLKRCNSGIGAIALASIMGRLAPGAFAGNDPTTNPMIPKPAPHFAPRAKRVIYLHMSGSPPQHDLFDYRPKLAEFNGKPCPEEYLKG